MLTRRPRQEQNIWPGFVDVLATLLMVVIFLLVIFVVGQVYLNDALVGRDRALDGLKLRIGELTETLQLEKDAAGALRADVAALNTRLQASLQENTETKRQLVAAQAEIDAGAARLGDLAAQILALEALKKRLEEELSIALTASGEKDRQLTEAERRLLGAQAETAQLNRQLEELSRQMQTLAELLEISEEKDKQSQATIKALGERLNVALAGKVQELAQYRSEFFGRLRQILGDRQDIQIVNDRFVFQAEVLFDSGSAELGAAGRSRLVQAANTLMELAKDIPVEIDWVLQVEGHTDNLPITSDQYPSNWELSTARALSVVKYLIQQGVPANRLSAAGFGQFQPLDPRNDEIGRRRNRRIELKLTQR